MVTSDMLRERRLTEREARSYFASNPSRQTIKRWRSDGLRVGGTIVKLESLREGRVVVTTAEACDRFIARVTALREKEDRCRPTRR